jgi:hypothetical protein
MDASSRISQIVIKFRQRMLDFPGGEEARVTIVTPQELRRLLGVEPINSLEIIDATLTPNLISNILSREAKFVPLTTDRKLVRLVDRLSLASSIARSALAHRLDS